MIKNKAQQLSYSFRLRKKPYFTLLFLVTIFWINILPAHAYAGPGVAIGAIVVLFTVVFAFFGSLILRIFNLIKRFKNFLLSKMSKKLPKNSKNKKSQQ